MTTQTATCGFWDTQLRENEIIEDVCKANAFAIQEAGCVCGTPYNCSGVCKQGEELLNRAQDITLENYPNNNNNQADTSTTGTCGFFDSLLKEEIIENMGIFFKQ